MGTSEAARWYAILVGVVLVVVGLLGFISNPIVGEPASRPLFVTGLVHNLVHIVTGTLALYIGHGLTGLKRANGLIGFGVLNAIIVAMTLASPNMFGILDFGVNVMEQVFHAVLAVVSLGIGWWARNERPARNESQVMRT